MNVVVVLVLVVVLVYWRLSFISEYLRQKRAVLVI